MLLERKISLARHKGKHLLRTRKVRQNALIPYNERTNSKHICHNVNFYDTAPSEFS